MADLSTVKHQMGIALSPLPHILICDQLLLLFLLLLPMLLQRLVARVHQ